MAVSYNVASSATPTLITQSAEGSSGFGKRCYVSALTANGAAVYIGGDSGVTTGTGFEMAAGEEREFLLLGGEDLYVVSAAAQNVRVLLTGV